MGGGGCSYSCHSTQYLSVHTIPLHTILIIYTHTHRPSHVLGIDWSSLPAYQALQHALEIRSAPYPPFVYMNYRCALIVIHELSVVFPLKARMHTYLYRMYTCMRISLTLSFSFAHTHTKEHTKRTQKETQKDTQNHKHAGYMSVPPHVKQTHCFTAGWKVLPHNVLYSPQHSVPAMQTT